MTLKGEENSGFKKFLDDREEQHILERVKGTHGWCGSGHVRTSCFFQVSYRLGVTLAVYIDIQIYTYMYCVYKGR